jgi:cell division protein FtsB
VKSKLAVGVPLVLLLALAAAVTNVFPFRSIVAADRAIETGQAEYEATLDEIEALEAERDALLTDVEVERVARERFGYVKPGEQPYVVVTPRDQEDLPPEASPDPISPPVWYDPILDFLTGRDLTDG